MPLIERWNAVTRHRDAMRTFEQLSAHTLRDIGLDRETRRIHLYPRLGDVLFRKF
jgi:uncharacterized protein YjiS (DUF1127 family)